MHENRAAVRSGNHQVQNVRCPWRPIAGNDEVRDGGAERPEKFIPQPAQAAGFIRLFRHREYRRPCQADCPRDVLGTRPDLTLLTTAMDDGRKSH